MQNQEQFFSTEEWQLHSISNSRLAISHYGCGATNFFRIFCLICKKELPKHLVIIRDLHNAGK